MNLYQHIKTDLLKQVLNKRKLHQKALVLAYAVIQVAVIEYLKGPIQELWRAFGRLRLVAFAHLVTYLKKRECAGVAANQQIPEMKHQAAYKVAAVKSFGQDIVEQYQ